MWEGRGREVISPSPCWFSLNVSETAKAVTVLFCSIQLHFIRDVRVKFGISNLPQSPSIEQDSGWGISGFRISIQSLIKENCHNSRTNDDVEIKLGPATRVDKINKTTNKIFGDDLMSENCDVNTIFTIYDQFGEIRKPDSGRRAWKTYIFTNNNPLSYKNLKKN